MLGSVVALVSVGLGGFVVLVGGWYYLSCWEIFKCCALIPERSAPKKPIITRDSEQLKPV